MYRGARSRPSSVAQDAAAKLPSYAQLPLNGWEIIKK
jgi:hypothetical protein